MSTLNENDVIEIDLMEDDDEEEEEEEEIKIINNNEEIIDSEDDEEDDDDDMEDEDTKFIVEEETAEEIPEQIQDPMIVAELLNDEQADNQKDIEETEAETETNQPQTETKSLSLSAQVAVYLKGKQNIVVEKEESIAKSVYCTALSYHSKRDYDRAIDYYFKVLKREFVEQALVDPLQKEFFEIKANTFLYLKYLSLKNLGAIYLAKKNYSDASISLAKALTIEDKDPSVWYDYGVACFKNNDHAASKLALEKTLTLSPNHYPAFNLLLELSYVVGDIEGCDYVSKDILKLNSDHRAAKFIQKECNPNPYNLLFFQNTSLSNPFYKGWLNYCIPEDEKDETQKCLVKISELDWKFICTKLLKIYAYMKSDCEIKILYEEMVAIPDETDEVEEVLVVEEPKTQESLRRFKRKRYDLSVPLSKKPKTLTGTLAHEFLKLTKMDPISLDTAQHSNSDNKVEIVSQDISLEPLKKWLKEVRGLRLKLLDAIKHILELVCGELWSHKWPTDLSSMLSNMAFTLTRHNISYSFKTNICIAEILFDKYEETGGLGYFEMARKIFNKYGTLLLTSNRHLEEDIDRTTSCRALWLRGLMERSSKSLITNQWFELSKQMIDNDIILPNCTKNSIITKQNIETKILELNFNIILENIKKQRENGNCTLALKSVSEPLTVSLPEKSHSLLAQILCSTLGNIEISELETLDKVQVIAILDFFIGYFTKNVSDMLEYPEIQSAIAKIDHYTQRAIFPDEDIKQTNPIQTLAYKILNLLNSLGLGKRSISVYTKEICRFLKVFYHLAPFTTEKDRKEFLICVRKKVLYEFDPLRRMSNINIFLLKELHKLYVKSATDKSLATEKNSILAEISTVIFMTFDMKINLTDSGPDMKFKDCEKPSKVLVDEDANAILFKILKPTFDNKLEGKQSTRNAILPFIKKISNAFDTPTPCKDIKPTIEKLIDGDLVFEETITLPTLNLQCDNKDIHEEVHLYTAKYLIKELESTPKQEYFSDDEYRFSSGVYKMEKSLCCKPDNYNSWMSLGNAYYSVLEFLLDLVDVTTSKDDVLFKQVIDRQHLRLAHDCDFEKDLDIFTRRCLNCFTVALKLCTTTEEQGKVHEKLGMLLFSVHDCRKYFKQYLAPFSESRISNECFEHLQKAYEHDKKNNLILFFMARIRHKMDSPSSEYMHLYHKSLKMKSNEDTWFYFNYGRLGILDRKEQIDERIFAETYSSEIVTLSNSYYSSCPIINNLVVANEENFKHWRLVVESYYNMLKPNLNFFKCLGPISQCFSSENGPWNDLAAAESVLSAFIKKRINKTSPPTIELDVPSPNKDKKRYHREGKLLVLRSFLEIVTRKKAMDSFMDLIHWMIHELLDRDKHLSICFPDILSNAITVLFTLIEEKPSENHLKYAIPLYFAISKVRKNKSSLNNNQNLIEHKMRIREYLSKHPSTSSCLVTEKGTKKNLNTLYQKEYFVDLVKFKTIEREEPKEKKKEKKDKKEKKEKKDKKDKKSEKNEKKEKKDDKKEDKKEKKEKKEKKDKTLEKKEKKDKSEKKDKTEIKDKKSEKKKKKEPKSTEPLLTAPTETKRRKKQPPTPAKPAQSSSSETPSSLAQVIDNSSLQSIFTTNPESVLPIASSINPVLNTTPEKKSPSKKISSSPSKQQANTKSPKKEFIFHHYTPSTPAKISLPQPSNTTTTESTPQKTPQKTITVDPEVIDLVDDE